MFYLNFIMLCFVMIYKIPSENIVVFGGKVAKCEKLKKDSAHWKWDLSLILFIYSLRGSKNFLFHIWLKLNIYFFVLQGQN